MIKKHFVALLLTTVYKRENMYMRRYLLLLACCMMLFITACNKKDDDTMQDNPNEQIQQEEDDKPDTTPTAAPTAAPTSVPDSGEEADAEASNGNLIPGGYFEQLNPKWGTYKESGGAGTISVNGSGQLEVMIENTGKVGHAVQVFCDGFELLKNAVYEISFDISSTVDRTMEWRIQINGGDYHPYVSQEHVALSQEMKHIKLTFTMEEDSDPAPRFCFNLGYQEADGELAAHTVTIDNVELFLKDASNAEATTDGDIGPAININQVGYRTEDFKSAIFRDSSADTKFDVVNVETGEIVYTGDVAGSVQTSSAGETVAYGDFSNVREPGTYKLVAANSGESYQFVIADDVYDNISTDIVKMLYLQRCGEELTSEHAGDFAHAACHTQEATIYGTSEKKKVIGGWHDAGDYGRYVVPGAKAVADILLAFEDYSDVFNDEAGIPESGNGIPDILDEARYELEWMLTMQDKKTGGVHHKVTGLSFEGMVMPETVTDDLYIMPISNCATGDFAAVMAMAARIYESYDYAFAKVCLASAKSALSYLESSTEEGGYRNPDDVSTGEYPDTEDSDEYFWALSELYKTTGSSDYEKKIAGLDFASLGNGMGWQGVNLYGCYAYLTSEKQNDDIKKKLTDIFGAQITSIKNNIEGDGYFSSMGEVYPWGSNMTLANNGMALLMAKRINIAADSYQMAKKQFDYLLGANATSYCFVTGYGTLSPQNPHHRPSQALKTTMPGMLIGGANSNLEDPYAQNVLADKPAAKCYVDNVQSFSCNEITVYWNSPLIYLLAGLMAD